jgi:hypothetical protein
MPYRMQGYRPRLRLSRAMKIIRSMKVSGSRGQEVGEREAVVSPSPIPADVLNFGG